MRNQLGCEPSSPLPEGRNPETYAAVSSGGKRNLNLGQTGKFYDRPYLDGTLTRAGYSGGDGDRFIQIFGFHHEEAAELFRSLSEWTVLYSASSFAYLDAGSRGHRCSGEAPRYWPTKATS
jgi:hypothetical protein